MPHHGILVAERIRGSIPLAHSHEWEHAVCLVLLFVLWVLRE